MNSGQWAASVRNFVFALFFAVDYHSAVGQWGVGPGNRDEMIEAKIIQPPIIQAPVLYLSLCFVFVSMYK